MAANYEEILKLIVDTGESVTTINQLKKRISELKKEAGDLTIGGADEAAALKKIQKLEGALKDLSNRSIETSNSIKTASREVKGFGDAATVSGGAAIALGQLFSDIGQFGMGFAQGIRAIANNVSQLATLFSIMVVQAGGVRAAFRALWASMMGPLGIVVAIQAVVGAIDLWANSQRKAKEESKKLTESFKLQDGEVQGLYNAYKKLNPISKEAVRIKKDLAEALKVDIDNYEDLDEAILDHIKVLELEAEIKELIKEKAERSAKVRRQESEITAQLAANEEIFKDQSEESLRVANLLLENSPQLIQLRADEAETTSLLGDKYKELYALLKEGNKEENKKYKLKKEFLIVDSQALELMERTLKLNQLLQNAELERSALISEYINGEKTKAEKLFDEYSIVVNAIDMLNESQSEKDRLRALADYEYKKKLRQLEEQDVKKMLDNIEAAQERASKRIQETERRKQDAIYQLASASFGFLIALNQALVKDTEEERKKAFKRDKALRSAQVIIDTARGVTSALAMTPPNPILATAIGVQGAANLATILATQYEGSSSSSSNVGGGIQGGYPYPMSGFSTIDPQFPDRTGSLNIIPRTQRIVVLESDITGAQKTSIDREQKAKVG